MTLARQRHAQQRVCLMAAAGQLSRAGQPAEVYLPALDRTFPGQVAEVTPATAAVAAPAQPRAAGNANSRPIQTVSIRIDFDRSRVQGVALYPGMSAEVVVHTR